MEAALHIYNGLFSFIVDDLYQYTASLQKILGAALGHANFDIGLAALQAASNFIQVAETEKVKPLAALLEPMTKYVLRCYEGDEETHLEDALIEFTEIAEVEPRYFKQYFKDVFAALSPIAFKTDFTNSSLRH